MSEDLTFVSELTDTDALRGAVAAAHCFEMSSLQDAAACRLAQLLDGQSSSSRRRS